MIGFERRRLLKQRFGRRVVAQAPVYHARQKERVKVVRFATKVTLDFGLRSLKFRENDQSLYIRKACDVIFRIKSERFAKLICRLSKLRFLRVSHPEPRMPVGGGGILACEFLQQLDGGGNIAAAGVRDSKIVLKRRIGRRTLQVRNGGRITLLRDQCFDKTI